MADLKNYFYNLNKYTDSEIKKFIFEFTHKLEPTILISLNKDFVNMYCKELQLKNEHSVKSDDYFGDLIPEEIIEQEINILVRIYDYFNGQYEIVEERIKFENLNYSQHLEMSKKIEDFQFCIYDIIISHNSQVVNKFPLLKTEIFEDKTVLNNELDFNRNYFNKKGFDLFNYLSDGR